MTRVPPVSFGRPCINPDIEGVVGCGDSGDFLVCYATRAAKHPSSILLRYNLGRPESAE
jgi:hypothetical protein